MSKNKDVKRGIVLYIDGKAVKSDVMSIKAEIRKLTKELDHMKIGSREYNEQMAKIKDLNTILKQHKAELRAVNAEQQFSLSKGVDLFNKYAASITAVVAALTGVVLKLNSFRRLLDEREDVAANLKSLTGLDDDAIKWLEQQAVKLSTTMDKSGLRIRQSASEILDAYMLVGSNKPELLSNKEALNAVTVEVLRLSTASKMGLKQSVDAVTTALNQYGASADQAARYVNVLAAGSKVGASAVDAQTAAILKAGTIAATSNIPIEQLVGSIEMLGEKGLKNEIAGTGLKTFFTRLATGATDTNPKVVGLYTALDNLNQKVKEAEMQQVGGGTTLLKKLFGDEGMQTAMILTQNADKVRYYAEAVTDTNIALEQAATNSDTRRAKLAQVKNELNEQGMILMKELNPAITSLLNRLVNWSRHTVTLVKFIADNRTALSLLTTSVVLYTTWVNRKNIADKMQLFWNQQLLVSFRALNTAMKANPYVLLATGAITAVGVLVDLKRKQDAVTQSMRSMESINKKSTKEYENQASRIELLTKIVHNNNMSLNTRRERLEELKSIVPGYNAQLTDEGEIIRDNTDAIKDYLVQLEKQIKLKSAEDELTELFDKQRKVQNRLRGEEEAALKAKNNLLAAQSSAALQASKLGTSGMKSMYGSLAQAPKTMQAEYTKAANAVSATKDELDGLAKAIGVIQKEVNERTLDLNGTGDSTGGDGKCPKCGNNPCTCNLRVEGEGDVKKQLQALELEHGRRIAEIKKQYLEDDEMTQSEYNKRIQDAEFQLLNDKLKVLGLEESQRQQINERILDMQIKQREDLRKQRLDDTKDTLSANQKKFQLEAEQLAKDYQGRLISREEFLKKLLELQKTYEIVSNTPEVLTAEQQEVIDKYIAKIDEVIAKYKETATVTQEWKEITINAWGDVAELADMSFDNMTVLLNKLAEDLLNIGEGFESTQDRLAVMATFGAAYLQQLGVAVGQTLGGAKDSLEDFLKSSLQMVLEVIKQQLIAEQAAAIASVTMKDITTKGFAGIATAAAKIALITAAFEAAKTAIGNFYTGGYTGSGAWDEPKGIVHSNEFVANRYAVANPAVRPVLDLIDSAQRSGTIANLTGGDIAAVAGGSAHPVAAASSVMQLQAQSDDRELKQTVRGLSQVLSRLVERLDEPIEAYGVISGRHGWRQKLDEYDRLLNNKSRKP